MHIDRASPCEGSDQRRDEAVLPLRRKHSCHAAVGAADTIIALEGDDRGKQHWEGSSSIATPARLFAARGRLAVPGTRYIALQELVGPLDDLFAQGVYEAAAAEGLKTCMVT